MRTTLTAVLGLGGFIGALCLVNPGHAAEPSSIYAGAPHADQGTPVIQFETNFYDFGKLIAPGSVSGVFKFKNAGTGVLELAPPEPSCGCTSAKAEPDRLAPGESGKITYSINLDHDMGQVQKHIEIHSNDPQNPDLDLTIQLDYTPLYELNPLLLRVMLPADKSEVHGKFMIVRNDGKPLALDRIVSSQKWASAVLDPATKPDASSAMVDVTAKRPDKPLQIMMANIDLWAKDQPDRPVQTLFLSCQMQGELSATPAQIYWVIPDFGGSISNYPAAALTRRVKLKSILDEPVSIENVTNNLKGLTTRVVPDDGGKTFDLILKFAELPQQFISGNVMITTSSPLLPQLNLPVVVSVAPK